ncbi:glycosyltransferase [Rivularia sp. PCC 7116]|uniref:glycosyltransferase family 4 protein n=1 Tax=Rivularia sp. PCC 7116 TaxID=373994 RepID=UPI00029EFAA5|nr:glycosyltransferase family 4 protein [Rivularia sp. PCC 7116]AFY52861.1 glycosyltransferase [Rivularia sp. PCC 7116]
MLIKQKKTTTIRDKIKLTLIIYSLSSGGAERVISILANYWAEKGWKITLLTLVSNQDIPFYKLDSRINQVALGIAKESPNKIFGLWNNLNSIRILRSAINQSQPDVVISFMDTVNVLTLLATKGLNIPVLISERNNPIKSCTEGIWTKLRKWTYPSADAIIVQTQRIQNYFQLQLQKRILIIPNPVVLPSIARGKNLQTTCEKADKLLIAMGRLEEQKGFDLLLQAFAKLEDKYPQWKLVILGEGSLRPQLELLREQLELTERIDLPGRVKNPHEYLQRADLFVMSSRFEGFPNALCEAMACGLAVISFDCPTGPREIISHGRDGILVPNEDLPALTVAMENLMSDEKERQRLASNAPKIVQRFNLESVAQKWEELIDKLAYSKVL